MAVLKKNGNKKIKNYFDYESDSPGTLKYKRSILAKAKLDTPMFSWPKDKTTLLSIINTYLASLQLAKVDSKNDNDNSSIDDFLKIIDDALESNHKPKDEIELADTKQTSDSGVNSDAVESKEIENIDSKTENLDESSKTSQIESKENGDTPDNLNESDDESKSNNDQSDDEAMDEYVDEGEYVDLPGQIYDISECTAKMLGNIVRILNYRSKVLKKIRLLKSNSAPLDVVNDEIEKVAVYNIVLAKYLPILNKQDVADNVNLKTATKVFEDVCAEGYDEIPTEHNIESEIKKNKEEQDFDIISALNYCGVTIDKNEFGDYAIAQIGNGNGIKYYIGKSEKSFSMSKKSCNRFLEQFLNKPIESRKFMTPGQVFITYIGEAEKSLGINTRSATELSDLFGAMNSNRNAKAYFKDAIRKYSRNSQEWKDFQKLFEAEYYSNKDVNDDEKSKIQIKQQAKRLVVGQLFEEMLNDGEIMTPEQIAIVDYRIGDISRDFGLDIDLDEIRVNKTRIERIEDYAFRLVNILHSSILDMQAFVQDIIDNYTVDYLRKEKIFLLQQDDQNEYITKKREYEDLIEKLSYDKAKDSTQQIAYYQTQIDELTQKIGSIEYRDAKEDLLKSKNNFRILLLNAKSQKELVKSNINRAIDDAKYRHEVLSTKEKIDIIRETLGNAPELIVVINKGKATTWTKKNTGEKSDKVEEKLSNIDKLIESTATKISDESHQKILEEYKIRESVKKAQKEERVKSVNAYINAIGTIVGNAGGVGAFGGFGADAMNIRSPQPTFASNANSPINFSRTNNSQITPVAPNGNYGGQKPVSSTPLVAQAPVNNGFGAGSNSMGQSAVNNGVSATSGMSANSAQVGNIPYGSAMGGEVPPVAPVAPNIMNNRMANSMPAGGYGYGMMPMSGMPYVPSGQPNFERDYQNFDFVSDGIEPCVIPFVVGYEDKGVTIYGNMLEKYANFDRYKYLLTTNNNVLFSYLETKKAQIQNPEQIISDLHIRYVKNAMAKSGLATLDSNLSNFDYKGDVRKFLTKFVPLNMMDMVISDYNDLIGSIDFDLLRDMIDKKFRGELEAYIPDNIKADIFKSANMIATIAKSIMSQREVRQTYEAYSSKMKQSYVDSLITQIESGSIPLMKLDTDGVYSRMLDYLSFSIKGQNVIVQSDDDKNSGFASYPRSTFFKQKDNADNNLKYGKTLTYEQNEIITTRKEPNLEDLESNVINLFGTLYKFNGGYNKLLLKLKPTMLKSGVKFMENLNDALKEKLDIRTTVVVEEDKAPIVPLVKFASKEKERDASEFEYNYDDDRWYVRKGFVLEREKVKEYALLLAFGMKYALDRDKKSLKEDFYKDNLLSINKINAKFENFSPEMITLITSVIRTIMITKVERYIDLIDNINKNSSLHINKMLYINRVIMESNSFDKKNNDEKKETIESLETGFNRMSEDLVNPHPEIYSSIEEIEHYETLYLYYALSELFGKYAGDERIISNELSSFFDDKKKEFRNMLLTMIRDHEYMNGYEQEMSEYFELNTEKIMTLDDKPKEEELDTQQEEKKTRVKIKNIDVIFKGIYDGFEKCVKNETTQSLMDNIEKFRQILSIVGTLPSIDSEEKDLEIALPNNQTIICNIKGFIQQYLFRYIVDKEHELGPFAYVVKELETHEEFGSLVVNLEEVAEKLNCSELGINLIAKFSSISLSNNGHVFKIGDNISTVVETINRLKTPTDIQKALNRDVFYKEGVQSVAKSFEQYFSRIKLENMD